MVIDFSKIGLGQILQGASRGVGMLHKWPRIRKAVGYLGVPILHDLKKEFGANSEKFDPKTRTGISYFIKRNFTWGVLISLLAGVGLAVKRFFLRGNAQQEQETPSLLKGFINLVSKILVPGGVISSMYADSQSFNVEATCGSAGVRKRARESGPEDKPFFEPRDISSLRKQIKHSIMRWNKNVPHIQPDGTTKYEDEQERIVALAAAPVGTIKGIFLGGVGTGKSVGMDEVCGWASVYLEETKLDKRAGIKEIASVRLDMNRLVSKINNPHDTASFLTDLANLSQSEKAAQLAGFMQKRKIDELTNILGSIPDLIFDARKRGVRLIVQIDEIDSIWKLALNNEKENPVDFDVLELIARQFQSIIDAKSEIDILMTTNADSPEEILGIKQFPEEKIPVGLRGLLDRVTQLIYRVSHPTPKTQSQQIAAYLLELKNNSELNNPTLEKLLAPELYEPIKDVSENEREDKLAEAIYKKLIAPNGEEQPEKLIFANLNGRDITAYALPGMVSSKLKVRNVPVSSPQISIEMIENALMPYVISKSKTQYKTSKEGV